MNAYNIISRPIYVNTLQQGQLIQIKVCFNKIGISMLSAC